MGQSVNDAAKKDVQIGIRKERICNKHGTKASDAAN